MVTTKGADVAKDGSAWVIRSLEQSPWFKDGRGAANAVCFISDFPCYCLTSV